MIILEAKKERQAPKCKNIPNKVKMAARCKPWMFEVVDRAISDHETNNS